MKLKRCMWRVLLSTMCEVHSRLLSFPNSRSRHNSALSRMGRPSGTCTVPLVLYSKMPLQSAPLYTTRSQDPNRMFSQGCRSEAHSLFTPTSIFSGLQGYQPTLFPQPRPQK